MTGTKDLASADLITLPRLTIGQAARIQKIQGDSKMARRLLSLGLRVGSEVEVLQRRDKGVVVACAGNRVALGGSVASKLYMEPLSEI